MEGSCATWLPRAAVLCIQHFHLQMIPNNFPLNQVFPGIDCHPWEKLQSVMDLAVSFQWHGFEEHEQSQTELQKISHREMASSL